MTTKQLRWTLGVFASIHIAFLVGSIVTLSNAASSRPYYQMEVGKLVHIDVYPIQLAILLHSIAVVYYATASWWSSAVVENIFSMRQTNPTRWVWHFVGDGLGLMGLMILHGVGHIETFAVVFVLWGTILALCYYQDEYLNLTYTWQPNKEPHFFAIPAWMFLVTFLVLKAMQSHTEKIDSPLTEASLVALLLCTMLFVVQRFQVQGGMKVSTKDEEEGEEEVFRPPISRSVNYEIMFYLNSTLFQAIVSWMCISITRENVTLKT